VHEAEVKDIKYRVCFSTDRVTDFGLLNHQFFTSTML
jgi:hypothetical protein